MATPSNTDTSIVKEEICDDEDIETHQRVYMLPNPNPNQTNHSTITTIATSSSLKVPSRCSHSDEDDLDTFSAIKKRFSMYASGNLVSLSDKPYSETLDKIFTVLQQAYGISQPLESFESSALPQISSDFLKPELIKTFIHSIMKNHSYQRCISTKLKEIGARLEEAKRLKGYIRILKDFQFTCKTRTGQCSSLKRDANVQLISYRKSMTTHYSKVNNKKLHAMFYGPLENTHVANYKMVLMKYPVSLHKQKWSKIDEDSLREGIEQQFQEMLLQKAVEHYSGSDESCGDLNDFEKAVASIKDVESTPENLRLFLPKVDWQRLACMYVSGRSGAECEARWLNIEDPLVNKNLWTNTEEKKLLIIIQKRGLYNWIEIAKILNTNRTPFQCLARYQQSLNSHIMKQEWTAEDDAQLCEAVEACGEHDWQQVAFKLERRTGTQCSNRWHNTLNPKRERVGRWTVEEDQHLKVAVMLFGPKTWNKIAQFVSGRTQVQCRERWMNVLDPSLNLQEWTEEEDSKLKAAIAEHGHCWSKVAASVAPRTDNQCRRRWKVLLPHEAPLLQAARKIQKSSFISNFVDRREERPALCPSDFLSLPGADAVPEAEKRSSSRKKNKTSRENRESKKQRDKEAFNIVPCEVISERSPSEAPASSKNVSRMENDDIPEPFVWDETILKLEKTLKLQSRNRCTEPVHVLSQELTTSPQPLNLTANGDDVQTLVNEGTHFKKRKYKSCSEINVCFEPTKGQQDEFVSPDYLNFIRTHHANGGDNHVNVMLSKRRKAPKLPLKRSKFTESAQDCQEPSLSLELAGFPRTNNVEEIRSCNGDSSTSPKWEASKSQPQNCECREPAEHQVLSLPQIETMSPRKIKQVLPNSLMIVPNSYNGLKSECGEGQNQPNDLNGASSLVHEAEPCCSISGTPKISSSHNTQLNHHPTNIQATVMENQECVHGDGTLMEMEGIKLETQCDIGDCSSLSVSQSFRSSDWHSLSHQTNGTSDVALSMERMINAAGLSLNNSLDYFPCPESIIEEPSNSLEQDGV